MWHEQAIIEWSLLLLAATVWSFAHLPLGLSARNTMVLSPGCEGCARCSFHKKNLLLVWFIVKRRGCCCNLSVGVAVYMRFTTNGMCTKNNTHIYVAQTSNNRVISLGSPLLLAVTVQGFAHMPFGFSNRNKIVLWSGCEKSCQMQPTQVRSVRFVEKRRDVASILACVEVWFNFSYPQCINQCFCPSLASLQWIVVAFQLIALSVDFCCLQYVVYAFYKASV